MLDYVKTSFFTTGQLKTINKVFIRDKYNSHYALFIQFIYFSIYLFIFATGSHCSPGWLPVEDDLELMTPPLHLPNTGIIGL